jgi:hypothetical protein
VAAFAGKAMSNAVTILTAVHDQLTDAIVKARQRLEPEVIMLPLMPGNPTPEEERAYYKAEEEARRVVHNQVYDIEYQSEHPTGFRNPYTMTYFYWPQLAGLQKVNVRLLRYIELEKTHE